MMIIEPHTLEEAKAKRYDQWAGNPKGYPYNPKQCAYDVPDFTGWHSLQCSRKPGHGFGNLYCKQHAKMLHKRTGDEQ